MIYADYDYYVNMYMGVALTRDRFDRLIGTASARIDGICGGIDENNTECVKMAACAVCDVLEEFAGREYISSESSDGYSVAYCLDSDTQKRRIYEAARVYLDDELLYRGIV